MKDGTPENQPPSDGWDWTTDDEEQFEELSKRRELFHKLLEEKTNALVNELVKLGSDPDAIREFIKEKADDISTVVSYYTTSEE